MAIKRIIGQDGLPYLIGSPDEAGDEQYSDWSAPDLPSFDPGFDTSPLLPESYPGQSGNQNHIRLMPFADINDTGEYQNLRLYDRLPEGSSNFQSFAPYSSDKEQMPGQAPVKGLLLRVMAANDESGANEPAMQANDVDRWSRNSVDKLEGEYPSSELAEQDAMYGKTGLLNRFSYPESKGSKPQFILPGEWENNAPMMRGPYGDHIDQHANFRDSHSSLQLYSPVPLSYSGVGQNNGTESSLLENLNRPHFSEMAGKSSPMAQFFSQAADTSSLNDDFYDRQNNPDSYARSDEMSNNVEVSSWDNNKIHYAPIASNAPDQLLHWNAAPPSEKREYEQFLSKTAERTKNLWRKIRQAYEERKQQNELLNSLNPNELKPFPLIRHPRTGDEPNTFNGKEPPIPEFLPGPTAPAINRGKGSGTWKENETEYLSIAEKKAAQGLLKPFEILYPDATRHLQHYFDNTGEDYQVDLKRIVETTDAGRDLYLSQRNAAIKYAMENAKDGVPFSFSSKRLEQRSFAEGTENWFYASGNFSGYSQSKVIKNGDEFSMNFELNFVDPYNWDRKETDIGLLKVADAALAKFHQQGVARDFLLKGRLPLIITWKSGSEMNPVVKIDQSKMPELSNSKK